MIIKMTSIVDVSIQAVSPALNTGKGSVTTELYDTVISSAKAEPAKTPRPASNIEIKAFTTVSSSKCTRAGFTGTNSDNLFQIHDKYFAVPDFSG